MMSGSGRTQDVPNQKPAMVADLAVQLSELARQLQEEEH